nr:MAG TPA: hypothetical protein [Caudoviricetes sp.]
MHIFNPVTIKYALRFFVSFNTTQEPYQRKV